MDITLEQVERLREKADVSYAQAKEALEYSGGNLLDALIYLEERGMIPRPEGAYYSTRGGTSPQPASAADSASQGGERKEKKREKEKGRQYGSRRGKARERGSQGPAPHLAPLADRK